MSQAVGAPSQLLTCMDTHRCKLLLLPFAWSALQHSSATSPHQSRMMPTGCWTSTALLCLAARMTPQNGHWNAWPRSVPSLSVPQTAPIVNAAPACPHRAQTSTNSMLRQQSPVGSKSCSIASQCAGIGGLSMQHQLEHSLALGD